MVMDGQAKIKTKLDNIQSYTLSASYQYIAGFLCLMIWVCGTLRQSISMIVTYEESLNYVLKHNLGMRFLKDENIAVNRNLTYITAHYGQLTNILNNMNQLSIKNPGVKGLSIDCVNISILISILPFVLNTARSSNIFVILGAVLIRATVHTSSAVAVICSCAINLVVGGTLIFIHFVNLHCLCSETEKEKTQ
jgi:hypothetical protein